MAEGVTIRRHMAARRLTLRVDGTTGAAWVSAPLWVSDVDVRRFVDRHAGWLADRRARVPGRILFQDGASIPVLGTPHRVRATAGRGRPVERTDGELLVSGDPAHLSRRLTDYLRDEARRVLSDRARAKAAEVGRRVGRVTIRDTRSRWGSCAANGRMSFCWRLILAPDRVLDYVVAHEVAHLVEMNHSPAFWALCRRLCDDVDGARHWLRQYGGTLHRYGG